MLKNLLIFAFFATIFAAQAMVASQETGQRTKSQEPTASTTRTYPANQENRAPLKDEPRQDKPYDVALVSTAPKDSWDKIAVMLNMVLAAVGLAGVIAAFTTLSILKKQTKAAEDAASAARDSAQALVNAERARMGFDIKEMGRSFSIDAQNVGKTSARVVYAHGFSVILASGESLPVVPAYVNEPDHASEWIGPGQAFDLLTASDRYGLIADLSDFGLCERIRDKKAVFWVFGCIRYFDGVSTEKREKRFCFATSVEENSLETYLYPDGPDAYRSET